MVEALTNRLPFGNVSVTTTPDNPGQIYYEVDSTNGGFKAYRHVEFSDPDDANVTFLTTHATVFTSVNLQQATNDYSAADDEIASIPYAGHVAASTTAEAALILPTAARTTKYYGYVQCFGHRSSILAAAGVALGDTLAIDIALVDGSVISVVDKISGTISTAEVNASLLDITVRRVGMAKTASTTTGATNSIDAYLSGMFM